MAIKTGFPSSGTIAPGVRIAEKDLSFVPPAQTFHRAALVGFASKGPINSPTIVRSTRDLHIKFGYPHPDVSDPYLVYAAEQYLLISNNVVIVRVADEEAVSDEAAVVADKDIPVAGGNIIILADEAGDYDVLTDSFFRWKLNGVEASKTLHVAPDSWTADDLADELNGQLTPSVDGIEFFVDEDDKIGVSTTYAYGPDATLELLSVQNALYGPKNGTTNPNVSGALTFGLDMTQAVTVSDAAGYDATGYAVAGEWNLTGLSDLQLLVVVDGTDSNLIDNTIQVIDLVDLEGDSVTTADIVNEINAQITDGTLPGGFFAVGGSVDNGPVVDGVTIDIREHAYYAADNVTLVTMHHGKTAKIIVKSDSTAAAIFDFPTVTSKGTSPAGITGEGSATTGAIIVGSTTADTLSFTLTADSAGIEGNATQVIITNHKETGTFKMDVYNNSVSVESWSQLTKNPDSSNYVSTYLERNSNYVRVTDNTDTLAPPKNGTYSLTGGLDGIPSDPDDQDNLLVGSDIAYTGMYALSESEQINIDLVAVPGHSSTTVVTELIRLCQDKRQDCMAIIDPPFGLTVKEIIQWQNGVHPDNTIRFDSDFAALYWPWVKIRDNFNRVDVWVPPSGSILGVYARSDSLGAPWLAPAGDTRGIVTNIADVYDRPNRDELDEMYGDRNAINAIVQYADSDGFVVVGQKTLQRLPTQLDRVATRRMLFYAEKVIKVRSRALLFEPHDTLFHTKFIQIATEVLREIQIGRGINDFIIEAGYELNTADVIDRNEFRANIGIQPSPAVEFMFLEFSVHRTNSFASTAEV